MNYIESKYNMVDFIPNPNIDKASREIENQKKIKLIEKRRKLHNEFTIFALKEMRGVSLSDFLKDVDGWDKKLIDKFLIKNS